jgi:hypothetical protein
MRGDDPARLSRYAFPGREPSIDGQIGTADDPAAEHLGASRHVENDERNLRAEDEILGKFDKFLFQFIPAESVYFLNQGKSSACESPS